VETGKVTTRNPAWIYFDVVCTMHLPSRRFEGNIKIVLQEVGCGGMDWIDLDYDRDKLWVLVNAVMNLRVPQNPGNLLASWELVSFSRKALLHGVSTERRISSSVLNICAVDGLVF
jgi:hypothetical protein